jgi:hypothetical protein
VPYCCDNLKGSVIPHEKVEHDKTNVNYEKAKWNGAGKKYRKFPIQKGGGEDINFERRNVKEIKKRQAERR